MIFDPVNSVASPSFYRKVSGQTVGRSLLYICYLVGVFSLCATLALKIKVGPTIDETFEWLERSVPTLTYADGKVTSAQPGPVRLQHPDPKLSDVSLMIDTSRTDPVTPQQMEDAKVLGYLTSTAFYLKEQGGQLRVYDLSKGAQGGKPVTIDAGFFRNADIVMGRLLYPGALLAAFAIFLAWKLLTTMAYSLVALMINAMAGGQLEYAPLLNISIYAQTAGVLLAILSLFLPFAIPGYSMICVTLTAAYIWLAVKQHSASPLPSPSEPAA